MDTRGAHDLVQRLNRDATRIASRFGLRYRSIEAEHPNVKRRYGICYEDGSIRLRLAHVVTGSPLKYSSLVNTLCHELAHLRHFDHGPRFESFYRQILAWARKEGIYRPGWDPLDPRNPASMTARGEPPPVDAETISRKPDGRPTTSPVQPEFTFALAGWRASAKLTANVAATRRRREKTRTPEQLSLAF